MQRSFLALRSLLSGIAGLAGVILKNSMKPEQFQVRIKGPSYSPANLGPILEAQK